MSLRVRLLLRVALALAVPATPAVAATYYVATTGDNSRSCATAQTLSTPKATITAGVGCLSAGDTLSIRGGTYPEVLIDGFPGGTSWNAPVTLKAYPGETVMIQPTGPPQGIILSLGQPSEQYIIFDSLIFDGNNKTINAASITGNPPCCADGAHHIRFVNCEFRNVFADFNISHAHAVEFLGGSYHDNSNTPTSNCGSGPNGCTAHHAFYVKDAADVLIDGVNIYNISGYGLHFYSGGTGQYTVLRPIVRNTVISNTGLEASQCGMLFADVQDALAYNNVLYGNIGCAIAIGHAGIATNVQLYNNTVTGNGGDPGAVYVEGGSGHMIQNNILWNNAGPDYTVVWGDVTADHNLTGIDPLFVNAASHDYHLQGGSPAIDVGVVIAGVTGSYAGVAPDVGRYEFNPGSPLDALTPGTWYQVPASHLRDAVKPASSYPDYSGGSSATYNAIAGADGPPGIMSAWSGASWDATRDRLYVWGGGHGDYAGNEVYAFDLASLAWLRLTDPYTRVDASGTVESSGEYPDSGGTPLPSQPRAVHTYNYVQYVPAIDRFCSLGVGPTYSQALPGSSTNKVHCFNPTTTTWALQATRVVSSGGFAVTGGYSAIDASTGHVFLHSTISNTGLWEWNASTDTWTRRTASGDGTGQFTFSRTAAIDPTRHWFVAVGVGESGNGTELLDLTASPVVTQAITTTGDKTLESKQAPGFVWDTVLGKFVGWAGGADVYTLDPATWIWTKVLPDASNTVIPTAPAANGTYGRFAYIASTRLYVVVNDIDQSVYIYKPFAAAATTLTSVALTSTSTGDKPFSVGLGFKKGEIPSGSVPTLDIPTYQTDVKRVWNDGSVKHAIVSGTVALTANTPRMVHVASGSAPSGTALTCADIATANPAASVQAGSIGTVTLSSLLASPVRTWLSGPQMVECHYYHLVGSDTTLGVWFHVRLFAGGVTWIRALVENGFLDVNTVNKSYIPTVTLHGTSVYTNGGSALTHYPHTRYSVEHWSTDPAVTVTHDMTYLMASKLVPNYALGAPTGSDLNSLTQTYSPLSTGDWSPNMGDTGYQPQIGILPQWDAMHATSGGDARAWRATQANAHALSTYPIVWRSSSTHLPIRPSAFAAWTVDGAGQGGETQVCASSTCFDIAHHGSGGYLAYLLTGEYAHLETLQFVASMGYLMNTSGNGSGTARLLTGQTRAVAWILRSIGQLAGIGALDTVTTDYQTLLAAQATHWQTLIDTPGVNPLGYLYSYELASGGYGPGQVAPWQQHFWVQAMGAVSDLEPLATMTTWNSVRDWLYRSAVGIVGPNGSTNYCFTVGGAINLTISLNGTNQDPTLWDTSWGHVWFDTFAAANTSCANTLTGGSGSDPLNAATGYWGNLLPAIAYATEHGATGASASWTRLTGATNWAAVLGSGFGTAPQFGIVPRSVPMGPVLTVPIFHKH